MSRLLLVSSVTRMAAGEWRAFGAPRYRPYFAIGVSQGIVLACSGTSLILPLLLSLGMDPGPATLVATLGLIGPAAQLVMPTLLQLTHGNLRALTLLASVIGETRGLWLAGLIGSSGFGGNGEGALIAGLIVATGLMGVCSGVAAANLQAWFEETLPEPERRFVAPRVVGLGLAVSALLLSVLAVLLGAVPRPVASGVYVTSFALGGLAGLVEIYAISRLPFPRRLVVERISSPETRPSGLGPFTTMATLAALGTGLFPYFSVYAISVLGATASYAVALSALTSCAQIVASTVAAAVLADHSSTRLLRVAYVMVAAGSFIALSTFTANPYALPLFTVDALLVAAGFAMGQIATNERLFRIIHGPATVAYQGRFLGLTAGSTAVGSLASGLAIAAAPIGYPVFAALFLAAGVLRVLAAARLQVADSWRDARDTVAMFSAALQAAEPENTRSKGQ